MTRISRYVLSDLSKVFLAVLAGMTLLMLVAGLTQEAIRQGLGPMIVLRLIPYAVPNALRFAVPGTILFAACSVYGRIAAANELVAIKSLGISPLRLVWPGLALAFFISLFNVWLNDLAVSWGRLGIQRIVVASVEEIAYGMLKTQRAYSNRDFSINVKRVDGRRLIRPTICFHSAGVSGPVLLTAEEAELVLHADRGLLSIFLSNGEINVGGVVSMRFPDTIEREIPLSAMSDANEATANPSTLAMHSLTHQIDRQQLEIANLQRQIAAAEQPRRRIAPGDPAAFFVLRDAAGKAVEDTAGTENDSDFVDHSRHLRDAQFRLHRLQTEPWRRWATGFSSLFFVMVGVPLAMRFRNADLWTTFAVCFLPILILYYPLLAIGVDQAKSGALPPYSVWLGNVILGLISLPLLRGVARY